MDKINSKWRAPITTLTVIPTPVAITGTITSDGTTVTGDGTDFLNELKIDDWIWDANQEEVHQIQGISSRLEVLYLRTPFAANIAAPIALIKVPDSEIEELSLLNDGAGAANIDGNDFPAGIPATFKKESPTRGRKGFISPKVIDGSASVIRVLTIK